MRWGPHFLFGGRGHETSPAQLLALPLLPSCEGAGFRCHVRCHCAEAAFLTANRPDQQGALSIKTGATLYLCLMPWPHPPASHLPARTAEIRLKSTLQGPKGARVLKQGGQPTDCEREGLLERDRVLGCGPHMVEGP